MEILLESVMPSWVTVPLVLINNPGEAAVPIEPETEKSPDDVTTPIDPLIWKLLALLEYPTEIADGPTFRPNAVKFDDDAAATKVRPGAVDEGLIWTEFVPETGADKPES